MNELKKIIYIGLLLSIPLVKLHSSDDKTLVKTAFVPLSQNTLYTQYHKVNYKEDNTGDWDWNFDYDVSLTYRYMQTRNDKNISKLLLNAEDGVLKFQGNDFGSSNNTYIVPRDSENALVATYFGLAPDANFTANFIPRIQNNVFDIQLAANGEKLWAQVNCPIVWSKWRINKKGTPDAKGNLGSRQLQTGGIATIKQAANGSNYTVSSAAHTVKDDANLYNYLFTTSFLDNGSVARTGVNLETSISPLQSSLMGNLNIGMGTCESFNISTDAEVGSLKNVWQEYTVDVNDIATIKAPDVYAASSLDQALNGYTFGDLSNRTYNLFKFKDSNNSQWGVADINFQVGYDFYKHDDKHFGAYVKAVIPTGTKLNNEWLKKGNFAPIIGNGRHVELGAGINWHIDLSCYNESSLNLYMDGYVTHLFKSSQMRSFDLDNQPMSRYALVKELTPDSTVSSFFPQDADDFGSGDRYAYNQILKVLGDVNTQAIDVSVDIKGEAIFDLIYGRDNWEVGAGYAFAGQTKQKATFSKNSIKNSGKCYGYLGNAGVSSLLFYQATPSVYPCTGSKCQASNNAGTTVYLKTNGDVCVNKAGGAYSYGDNGISYATASDVFYLPMINNSGLMNGQILHRIFGHIDYAWDNHDWNPEIGVLGSFGFSQDSYRTAEYWDLGLRFGLQF